MMRYYIFFLIFSTLTYVGFAQEFVPYQHGDVLGWDTSPYLSYSYSYNNSNSNRIPFRIMYPPSYDQNGSEKYPLILFFHGAGESGTNNEIQLVHGGQKTRDNINNGNFPGIALYPQHNAGNTWGSWIDRVKLLVDKLIEDYNVDPNRIYIHGLSSGGIAVWNFADTYPELVTAMHPMSAVPGFSDEVPGTHFIPIWLAQGGKDNNPTAKNGNDTVDKLRDQFGASIRYSYYPNGGHAIWNQQYNKSDFFSWFLEKNKTDIIVKYGQSSFCEGDDIDIIAGVSPGFSAYQWVEGDTTSTSYIDAGTEPNTINITSPGTYYVRFQRGTTWSKWSKPLIVDRNLDGAPQPNTEIGNQSVNLPTLSGQQSVVISGPEDAAFYQWFRNSAEISGATSPSYSASGSGSYSVSVRPEQAPAYEPDGVTPTEFRPDPQPCFSELSEPVIVTTQNGLNVPAKPTNFSANVLSDNSIKINWDDNADNELAFELYRSTQSGTAYSLIERIPATSASNPIAYIDEPVSANTTYYYRMRAVNNDGGSAYTPEVSTSTAVDTEDPNAPILSLAGSSSNSISLSWTEPEDNVGVTEYDVYRNSNLIATVSETEYINSGLPSNQTFSYTIRAKDASGNISVPSNQITARTINTGLSYAYYHHSNFTSVNQIESSGTLIRTGNVNNFDISIRDQDDRFAFIFQGYVLIPADGNYTFYTSSDDGSRLFINNNEIVNNDGTHGCQERNGTVNLTEGFAQIRVLMFENAGGECLQVRWNGPGLSKQLIPDGVLFENEFVPSNIPAIPSDLEALAVSNTQVDLSWTDNSNNENNFEIYRSQNQSSGYEIVHLADENAGSWSDTGLEGNTTYYYKIKAINFNGGSDFAGPVSVTTVANPAPPQAPSDLSLSLGTGNNVQISWVDNSSSELGFEIYRSTSNQEASFTLIQTTSPDVETYTDTQTTGNSTYYYRIRAKGEGDFSAFTAITSISTPNNAPVIEPVIDRSVKYGTTLILDVTVDDPDGDPISFTFTDPLPEFFSFASNGYGQGQFTISPEIEDEGQYTIEFTVDDGSGLTDMENFTITVSDNDNPVIGGIANLTIMEGFSDTLNVSVSDETLGTLTLQASNFPPFVIFNDNGNGEGDFIINPDIGQAGVYNNIKLLADDGEGGFSEATFNIIVEEVNRNYSVLINFGGISASSPWNNINTGGTYNLTSNDGVSQDVVFHVPGQWFNGTATSGLESDLYIDEVTQSFKTKPGGNANVVLQNLNPGLSYDLTMFAGVATEDASLYAQTRFTINSTIKDLNPVNNTSETVTYSNIKPNSNGQIDIGITRNGNGTSYILNSMVVDVYFEDGLPPSAPSNLSLTAISNSEVEIGWQDNSNNEQRFEIYRSEVAETGPFDLAGTALLNQTSFTDQNLQGSTLYYYKVRAVNSTGNSETQVGLVNTLNSAPELAAIDNVVMNAGETLSIAVSATDEEGNPITLTGIKLPDFAQLIDNGDGTGEILLEPLSNNVGFYGTNTIEAKDNFGSGNTAQFNLHITDPVYENNVFINLGAATITSTPWTNINSNPANPGTFTNFNDAQGNPTNIGLSVDSGWTAQANDGLSSGDNSLVLEDFVLQSYWYSQNPNAFLTLTGLEAGKYYNIDLLASINQWLDSEATYTVEGVSEIFSATFNEDNLLTFSGVQANASGEISISLNAMTNTVSMYLNAIIIKPIDEQLLEGPIAPTKFNASGISNSAIRLSWQDNAYSETGFEIYTTDEIGKAFTLLTTVGPDVETYTHTGLQPNQAVIYKVRAIGSEANSAYTQEVTAITIDKRILVNINVNDPTYLQAPAPWNNTNTYPATGEEFTGLIDENSNPADISIVIEDIGDGYPNNTGNVTGDNSGIYPDEVLQGYYYFNPNAQPGKFRINNLDPDWEYDLTFFGSENGAFTTTETPGISDFTVGNNTETLYTYKNTDKTVSINNIAPDEQNSILFEVDASNENNAQFGFFNAMVISVHRPVDVALDVIAPTTPQNLFAQNITDSSLTLLWEASTDNIAVKEYEIFQNGEIIDTTISTSLDVTGLSPDFNYVFTVRAVDRNNNKSTFSDDLPVKTAPPSEDIIPYYSLASGDLVDITSWNSSVDGTGNSPSNFDADYQLFVLNRDATLSQAWTISGTGSKLVVDDNNELSLDAIYTGVIDAGQNVVVNVNVSEPPVLGDLDPTSHIIFNADNNIIPAARYGDLTMEKLNSSKEFRFGNITVEGDLNVANGVSMKGKDPNGSAIIAKGNVSFYGIGTNVPEAEMLSMVFAAEGEQTISNMGGNVNLFSMHVKQGAQLLFDEQSVELNISVGNNTGGGLKIDDGATLDIGQHSLVVNGRGTINSENQTGKIISSKGKIEINSTSHLDSYLYFEKGKDTLSRLHANLANSGNILVLDTVYISELLEITDGTVTSDNTIVLASTIDGTAFIPEIKNRGKIEGAIIAQRYMAPPTNRIYRYMGSMISNATVADWQEEIEITGNFSGASTGPGLGSDPSVFYYDEPSPAKWIAYPTTNNQEIMEVGRGYAVYVRDLNSPITLQLTGEPIQGDFAFNLTDGTGDPEANDGEGDGWNLLANPYQSPIQWGEEGWQRSNVGNTVSIWDADYPGGGKFLYYDGVVNDPEFAGEIASGQGFWVQANSSSPALTISESAKINQLSTEFYRLREQNPVMMVVKLSRNGWEDKAFIRYSENGSKTYDPAIHGRKRPNEVFNLSSATEDGISLAINHLPQEFCKDSIALITEDLTEGTYSLSFDQLESFREGETFTLLDDYLNTATEIFPETTYTFEVTGGSGTFASNRFSLIIEKPEIDKSLIVINSASVLCETEDFPSVSIQGTQTGAGYKVLVNGTDHGIEGVGNGGDLTLQLNEGSLEYGQNTISLQAAFGNCTPVNLNDSLSIDFIKLPEAEAVEPLSVCNGASAVITVNSTGEDHSFRWYEEESGGEPFYESEEPIFETAVLEDSTTYYYTIVNANGCESAERVPVVIAVENMDQPEITQEGDVLVSSYATGNQWYKDDEIIEGATDDTLSLHEMGGYSVKVAQGPCEEFSDVFQYTVNATGPEQEELDVILVPNPASNIVNLKFNKALTEKVEFNIIDLTGRPVYKGYIEMGTSDRSIEIGQLSSGTYMIQLIYKEQALMNRLVVK
ncbi:fibronectin type III domain-containing protein [Marivirga sp. S37H4]|uniref:Fibronectin type III domain-containing protein n=1 Tax=Marivirga aurantiaca TaxID=2802615 RepID=A0A934X129_9BACT|nr:fibronectin type III domain-containing protein [Marivirga aurantiaca]MBK6266512.1 fibronectin type III domain-containing protein [Marivirga aurantiaca]